MMLLEHKPLDHYCAGCFQVRLPYSATCCPRCGRTWTSPKIVKLVQPEEILTGGLGFLAREAIEHEEDTRVLEGLMP